MPSPLKRLEDQVMKLPVRSRARLAERLIASLDDEPADPDAEQLWVAEAQRRMEEIAGGTVKGIAANRVFKKARAALSAWIVPVFRIRSP